MSNKIYLLTGAAGFLGGNVCRNLIERGQKVRAFILNGDPAAKDVPKEAEIVYGDLTDKKSLERLFDVPADADVIVIHCASIVALSPEPSQIVYDVNVTGTKNIVKLCIEHQVKKLVHVSSTGAIVELPDNQQMYEPSEFNPETRVGYYSKTKAMATEYVLKMAKETGLDASVVYPSGIFGPNDYVYGSVAQAIIKYCNGQMPMCIEGSLNSVDVRDLADAVITCTEKGRKGEGYILSNEMFTMRRLFELISKTSGAKHIDNIITGGQMKELTIKHSGGKMDETAMRALEFSIWSIERNNNFCSDKARKELGYCTRPIEETVIDSVKWLQSVGKI